MQTFIRVKRGDGRYALIDPDWIGFVGPGKERIRGTGKEADRTIDCLDVHLSSQVVLHLIEETEESLLSKMNQAKGTRVHVIEEPDPRFAWRPPEEAEPEAA